MSKYQGWRSESDAQQCINQDDPRHCNIPMNCKKDDNSCFCLQSCPGSNYLYYDCSPIGQGPSACPPELASTPPLLDCNSISGMVGNRSIVVHPCSCAGSPCGAQQDPNLVTLCSEGTRYPCMKRNPWSCDGTLDQAAKNEACQKLVNDPLGYCKKNPNGQEYCQAESLGTGFSAPIPCCMPPRRW